MTGPTSTFRLGGVVYAVRSEPVAKADVGQLTAAEREVMALILADLSNAEVARRRGTSVRTVANQLQSLFRKLGVNSRAELSARRSK